MTICVIPRLDRNTATYSRSKNGAGRIWKEREKRKKVEKGKRKKWRRLGKKLARTSNS
jgi:hypothetical protein